MPSNKFFGWLVFIVSLGAYVPLLIGGWTHPAEMNIACFILWVILAYMLMHSAKAQGYAGWRLNLAFLCGNVVIVIVGLLHGGYTFNLGASETILLFGIVGTLCLWIIVGTTTKRWNPDILYLGGIIADVASFYPVVKQYLTTGHERASTYGIAAWVMFALGTFTNFMFTERLGKKLLTTSEEYPLIFNEPKSQWKIWKESAFSLENFVMIVVTVILMAR